MMEATDATLTKIQKNGVLKWILDYGPPPIDFQWTEKEQEEWAELYAYRYNVSVLTHRPTDYYCVFGAHSVTTSPGIARKVENLRHDNVWAKKERACCRWLVDAKREVDTPDLWATIGQEKSLPTAAASATLDNQPFAAAEQAFIAAKLDEIKEYLLQGQQFDTEQSVYVEHEFAYLRESSRRFGRKDWLRVLMGVLFGQMINLALDPEKARGLLRLAGAAFQSLWNMTQPYLH